MQKIYLALIAISAVLVAACEKNELKTAAFETVPESALVKVIFFSEYRANPLNQISVNDKRVSSTLGGTTNPTPFPGGGLNTGGGSGADYLSLTPGSNKVSVAIPKVGTNTDSVVLANTTVNVESGKKYSLYFTDTAANTQSILVQDTLTAPDSGFARYKFVNLMPDVAALDLYIGTTKVASAIPYKGVSPSFTVPTNNSSTTWGIRSAGGATNLVTYNGTTSISNQRVYTVIARGYNAVTATSDFRSRKISLVINQ